MALCSGGIAKEDWGEEVMTDDPTISVIEEPLNRTRKAVNERLIPLPNIYQQINLRADDIRLASDSNWYHKNDSGV